MVKKALIIGINYYKNFKYLLQGCINDAWIIRNFLIDAYDYLPENTVIMRDDYKFDNKLFPNRENILRELNSIITNSDENDDIHIHYSGHGYFLNDNNNDETDRHDEVLVAIGNNNKGNLEIIIDDELNKIFAKNKSRTMAVFDCCNSGTIGDLKNTFRYNSKRKSIEKDPSIENKNDKTKNVFILSGARDDQFAFDAYNSFYKLSMGVMTSTFLNVIRRNKHEIKLLDLQKQICEDLIHLGFIDQTPTVSSSDDNADYTFSKKKVLNKSTINETDILKQTKIKRKIKKMLIHFNSFN